MYAEKYDTLTWEEYTEMLGQQPSLHRLDYQKFRKAVYNYIHNF